MERSDVSIQILFTSPHRVNWALARVGIGLMGVSGRGKAVQICKNYTGVSARLSVGVGYGILLRVLRHSRQWKDLGLLRGSPHRFQAPRGHPACH